ncbi:MAG: tRNA (adenosine(37)-N6)-threonylcarbamoyltransferase complex dimerization subunit type 1 TsaB [Clostridia bacterium]|nr:tRNA (adenosine(37)-N6)-threonylcarbamoyltransferase complex dimerization subunit type 1 TsaB [Clostridia bacterium]
MKILSFDSSAKTASVAVTDGETILSECFVNAGLTHSRTLMPMVDNALKQADMKIEEIDAFSVNSGPGSFTGIRIGVSAVKGLALANGKPCAGISTLEAIAYNFIDEDAIICASMDARCNQVYAALFKVKDGVITRICDDYAVPISELADKIAEFGDERIILAGDGAELFYNAVKDRLNNIILSSEFRRYQRAYGTALAAIRNNNFEDSSLLAPVYLRMPQAERELKLKKENK